MEFSFNFNLEGSDTLKNEVNTYISQSDNSENDESHKLVEILCPFLSTDIICNIVQTVLGPLSRVSLNHVAQAG